MVAMKVGMLVEVMAMKRVGWTVDLRVVKLVEMWAEKLVDMLAEMMVGMKVVNSVEKWVV